MSSSPEKLVIIGSGPAGWSSATYAARAQLQPLVYEGAISEKNRMAGTLPLGQLALTSEVENYAGFPHGDLGGFLESALPKERRLMMPPHEGKGVTGPELMELMRQQAANFGTRIVTDDIAKVDFSSRPFKLFPAEGGVVEATCVIVATGASANWLGLPSEEKFKNRGVSACAVCDGALPRFRNKPIVVVGGGDSAVEEATYLTKFASMVHLIHRRDELRASKIMAARAHESPKITIHFNSELAEVLGDDAILRALAVDPKFRGAGYGWMLADMAVSQARWRGVRRIYLLTETASDFVAAKFGFRVVDRSTLAKQVAASETFMRPAGAPQVAMRLDL